MKTESPQPATSFISTDPEIAAVDASARAPVLACLLSSVHWLVVGTFLLVYASSLRHPQDAFPVLGWFVDLSNNFSFFTFGRVWPAGIDALVYGWASTAGLGLAVWVLARTGRTPLRAPEVLLAAIVFWNIGVAIGLTGIFIGWSTGIELLEFPACASWVLWLAYAVFGTWAIVNYLARRPGHDHPAQSWILTALLAFPWLYAGGSILLSSHRLPGSGVIQGLLGAWYVHGLYTLWLAPLGLGVLYYLIPKISGLTLRFSSKTQFAFWTWVVFAPWTAVHDLVGGPFPASTVSFGLILSGLLFIPVALISISLVSTAFSGEDKHHGGIVLPFLSLAAVCFVAAGVSEQILSIRGANEYLRFTLFREANFFLWLYGFFSFLAFGAIYYIVPRLLNFGWRSSMLIRVHYYACVYGIGLLITMLAFGGIMQGLTLENTDPQVTISTVTELSTSFYISVTMCLAIVSIGTGIFAFHFGWTVLDWLHLQARTNRLAAEILKEDHVEPDAIPVAASQEASA